MYCLITISFLTSQILNKLLAAMATLFYETSKKDKRIFCILCFLVLPLFLLFVTNCNWGLVIYSLVCGLLIYINTLEKYVVTDQALIVERGYWKWSANVLEWDCITDVTSEKNGFRLDFIKPDGKKGFYIVKVKEWQSLESQIRSRLNM